MAQLDFPTGPNRYITVTYQSNNYLNEELDNKVKQNIASILIEVAHVKNIHSYVHGQIIIEVPSLWIVTAMRRITDALSEPMTSMTPPLLYTVELVSQYAEGSDSKHLIYVNGDAEMNLRFLKSIEEFWSTKP